MDGENPTVNFASREFRPRIYGVGAWTNHLHFACDLIAELRPSVLVELGVDRGESYFVFCQAAQENQTATRCFGVDTWKGDAHAGDYDETTFSQVAAHNLTRYGNFSTLLRASFDDALEKFAPQSIDVLHLDGLHTEMATRHDLKTWLPKVREGGIVLLHDVNVRKRDFGVWKVWENLRQRGRSFSFQDGPGLGIWEKPRSKKQPQFLEDLFLQNSQHALEIFSYYTRRAAELQERIAAHWRDGSIRTSPFAQQTVIQVFFTSDGTHREEDSVFARVGHEEWKNVSIALPRGANAAPLRIDFVSALTEIEIALIRVRNCAAIVFETIDGSVLRLAGDLGRVPNSKFLRFRITGIDPQIYLPSLPLIPPEEALMLEVRLRVLPA